MNQPDFSSSGAGNYHQWNHHHQNMRPNEIISMEQLREKTLCMQILLCACWYVTQNGSGAKT